MRLRLIIVRHTQTDDNARRIYTGHHNVRLNSRGIAQAQEIARRLADMPRNDRYRAIWSSDLRRTRMVAEIIGKELKKTPQFTTNLREVDVGRMAGMQKRDALKDFPEDHFRSSNSNFDYRSIGGEDVSNVLDRHHRFMAHLLEVYGNDAEDSVELPRIILVGHGTSLRLMFKDTHGTIEKLHEQGDYQEFIWPPVRG